MIDLRDSFIASAPHMRRSAWAKRRRWPSARQIATRCGVFLADHVIRPNRHRLFLWNPLCLAIGILLGMQYAPDLPGFAYWAFFAISSALFAGSLFVGHVPMRLLPLRHFGSLLEMSAFASLGLAMFLVRLEHLDARIVHAPDQTQSIRGWITNATQNARGYRINLLVDGPDFPRRYVAFTMSRDNAALLRLGAAIRCPVRLSAPGSAIAPGDFDYANYAFYQQIAATGFSIGPCQSGGYALPVHGLDRLEVALARMKGDVAHAAADQIGGEAGAFAAGLLVGDRSLLSSDAANMFRASGLAHLLAVSGMNMWLLAGSVMFLLRWSLGFIAPLALRVSIAKIAAGGALLACIFYLALCGLSASTLRAFCMTSVALSAVLLDARAISMRSLALAALAVLLLTPESVLDPGFQMSFAASAALVALYEMSWKPNDAAEVPPSFADRATRFVTLSVLASLVAGIATAPTATQTFHQMASYGFLANIAAAPVLTFVITPALLANLVLSTVGFEEPALWVLRMGLDAILAIGQASANIDNSVRPIGHMPEPSFALITLSIYWLAFWRGPLRLVALLIAAGGWLLAYQMSSFGWIRADGAAGLVRAEFNGEKQWLSWSCKGARTSLTRYRELAGLARDHETLDLAVICGEAPCEIPMGGYRLLWTAPHASAQDSASGHRPDVHWLDPGGDILKTPINAQKSCRSDASRASWILFGRERIRLRYYCSTPQFSEPDLVRDPSLTGIIR